MDPDAPPLVKADTFASQGEQLSSRRAYQQAHQAHTEAAKQYQLAAQATGDTGAAKALLLQRDKQLKLASEVLRKLERGKTKPAVVSSSPALATATSANAGSHAADVRSQNASTSTHRAYSGLNSPVGASHHHLPSNPYRRSTLQQPPIANVSSSNPAYNSARLGSNGAFVPPSTRDNSRIDASTMADSRYSRKSNSPSQSQISHSVPHSGESGKTSSVEESYYLMNTDNDPADPVTTFLTVVENMVEELGNAVAFASAPLHIGPPSSNIPVSSALSHTRQHSGGPARSENSNHTNTKQPGLPNQVLESFYVVPSINRPGKPAREGSTSSPGTEEGAARPNSAMNKTHEELVAENATLKETLDHLSKRLDWITKERQREKETLKDSVTIFARDVRRQAERLGQSTANLSDTRRQMPPPSLMPLSAHPFGAHHAQSSATVDELQRKLAQAQEETRAAKAEAEKQAATAQKYKVRYDDLRKAILEKRKAKEMATTAAAASSSKEGDQSASSTSKDTSGKEASPPTDEKVESGT